MELLTKDLKKRLPALYTQEKETDPMVFVKFFTPWAGWTWFITEGQEEGTDFRMFGLVEGMEREFGYVMLSELASVRGPLELKIERDLYFEPCRLSEIKKQ